MTASKTISLPTLWDLAAIVLEEVEKICRDERSAAALSREVVVRIIQGHVKNMEIEPPLSHALARRSIPG